MCPPLLFFWTNARLLSGKRDEIEKDRSRVEGMKRDIRTFEGRVEDFVARYAPDLSGGRVDQTVRELTDRVSKARVDSASQTKLSAERASRSKELQAAQATYPVKVQPSGISSAGSRLRGRRGPSGDRGTLRNSPKP